MAPRRLVEVTGVVVGAGTGRGEERVEQHVDVADGVALVLANELERVVGRRLHVGQVALREPLPVSPRHPERIEEHGVAAQLPPAPGGDAPELAARVYRDRRPFEAAMLRREQVDGDRRALARARRRDRDGRPFQGPADQRRVPTGAPLPEQDAPAPGEAAQVAAAEQLRAAVQVGLGAPPPPGPVEAPAAVDRRLEPEHEEQRRGRRRSRDHDQRHAVEGPDPVRGGRERVRVPQGSHDPGPERGGGSGERPTVEAEAEPQSRALAVGRHVGRERRADGGAEARGRDLLRTATCCQPRGPAAAGHEQESADCELQNSHDEPVPPPQLPAAPRRVRDPILTAPTREMPATAAPPVRSPPSSPAPARPPIQSRTADGSRSISLKDAFISP